MMKEGESCRLIRPEYRFSRLEQEILGDGIRRATSLLDMKKAEVRFSSSGQILIGGFPPDKELKKMILNPAWFLRMLRLRKQAASDIKQLIAELIRNLDNMNTQQILIQLKEAKKWAVKFLPFVIIVNLVVDDLLNDFFHILEGLFGRELANIAMIRFTRSEYATKVVREELDFPGTKTLHFPPRKPILITAGIDYNLFIEDIDPILWKLLLTDVEPEKRSEAIEKYVKYRLAVPLADQMSDENFYIWTTYLDIINNILWKVSVMLLEACKIEKNDAIFNHSITEIVTLVKSVLAERGDQLGSRVIDTRR